LITLTVTVVSSGQRRALHESVQRVETAFLTPAHVTPRPAQSNPQDILILKNQIKTLFIGRGKTRQIFNEISGRSREITIPMLKKGLDEHGLGGVTSESLQDICKLVHPGGQGHVLTYAAFVRLMH